MSKRWTSPPKRRGAGARCHRGEHRHEPSRNGTGRARGGLGSAVAACRGLRFAGLMAWRVAGLPRFGMRSQAHTHRGRGEKTHGKRGTLPGSWGAGGDRQLWGHGHTGSPPPFPVSRKSRRAGDLLRYALPERLRGQHEYALSILTTVVSRPTQPASSVTPGGRVWPNNPRCRPAGLGEIIGQTLCGAHND